jgi:hypothetical protein
MRRAIVPAGNGPISATTNAGRRSVWLRFTVLLPTFLIVAITVTEYTPESHLVIGTRAT